MDYLIKGTMGAAVVILIAALTKTRFAYLAGLAPLFPTFSLFAHILSYQQTGVQGLKLVAYFGLFAILPYSAYLITLLLLIDRWSLTASLTCALLVWFAAAAGLTFAWNHFSLSRLG